MKAVAFAILALGCAMNAAAAVPPGPEVHAWSNVEKLPEGTAVRVTELDSDRVYGRVMKVTALDLTLELESSSRSVSRDDIALVERFPTSLPKSIPGATVGLGAAMTLSSSAAPRTYQVAVAPAPVSLESGNEQLRDGVYVDAVALVATGAQMVSNAIEKTRKTVVVYRARGSSP
jgi:hypothetical protein